jgi:FkbM family methyltransferase
MATDFQASPSTIPPKCVQPDLIFDIGMHDGSDTAWYLARGFRVIAVDANPQAKEAARGRFATACGSGRLLVLNVGISDQYARLPFWVNEIDAARSSFSEIEAKKNGPARRLEVECVPLSALLEKYGIPYYLKVDIEGADYLAVSSLTPEIAPQYLSIELFQNPSPAGMIDALADLGYRRFKIINQMTHTQSTPLYDVPEELFLRSLRKLGMTGLVRRMPLRPARIQFDPERPKASDSGPFAEDTSGPWRSAEEVRRRTLAIMDRSKRSHHTSSWFDLHAAR